MFHATLAEALQRRCLCEICGAIYLQLKVGNPERKTLQKATSSSGRMQLNLISRSLRSGAS